MRKHKPKPRVILPDPKFNDPIVTRFVNMIMESGKKSIAFRLFYDALDLVAEKSEGQEAVDVWRKALNNVMPQVEVKSRRIGGATFQIPSEIRPDRKISVSMTNRENINTVSRYLLPGRVNR